LKDENRYQDNKEVGRPILESLSPLSKKTWSLKEIKKSPQARREMRKVVEGSRFTFSRPLTEDEDEEEDEEKEDDEEEITNISMEEKMTSPSSSKKNKRKKKKKQK
jgi:hypothetical protein